MNVKQRECTEWCPARDILHHFFSFFYTLGDFFFEKFLIQFSAIIKSSSIEAFILIFVRHRNWKLGCWSAYCRVGTPSGGGLGTKGRALHQVKLHHTMAEDYPDSFQILRCAMLRILCAIAVLVAAVGVAVYIHGQEKREAVKERVLEAKVVETEIVASDNGGTPWNFQQLPVVSPMDAAAATRMDRPFRYPSSFTKGWRIFDLDVGDLKKMYGSRPAGIGFGALIDQFEGDFFE